MHSGQEAARRVLSDAQREQFVHDGFVKLDNAFTSETADEARVILWRSAGCDPADRSTWNHPVVRLGDFAQEPFRKAVNSTFLHAAFDELVGAGRWVPRESLGGFPIRFPHPDDPGDTGWQGRALLMLFLFSDVGENDAPTRIRLGSHLRVPQLLAAAGEEGLSAMELGTAAARLTDGMPEATAMGTAGTVFLCHPFLVHAAQPHRGATPRFLAQPPLIPKVPLELTRSDGQYSLVERAILLGLSGTELEVPPTTG